MVKAINLRNDQRVRLNSAQAAQLVLHRVKAATDPSAGRDSSSDNDLAGVLGGGAVVGHANLYCRSYASLGMARQTSQNPQSRRVRPLTKLANHDNAVIARSLPLRFAAFRYDTLVMGRGLVRGLRWFWHDIPVMVKRLQVRKLL
jgi:hypothetical protein